MKVDDKMNRKIIRYILYVLIFVVLTSLYFKCGDIVLLMFYNKLNKVLNGPLLINTIYVVCVIPILVLLMKRIKRRF